jgi:hypothetical protein
MTCLPYKRKEHDEQTRLQQATSSTCILTAHPPSLLPPSPQDLDFIFTGFSGDCKWLSPGHLQYNVRNVKIEFRQPKVGRKAWWQGG